MQQNCSLCIFKSLDIKINFSADQVHKLPDAVTLQQGALCEPLSCLLHGWSRLQKSGCLQSDSRYNIFSVCCMTGPDLEIRMTQAHFEV